MQRQAPLITNNCFDQNQGGSVPGPHRLQAQQLQHDAALPCWETCSASESAPAGMSWQQPLQEKGMLCCPELSQPCSGALPAAPIALGGSPEHVDQSVAAIPSPLREHKQSDVPLQDPTTSLDMTWSAQTISMLPKTGGLASLSLIF